MTPYYISLIVRAVVPNLWVNYPNWVIWGFELGNGMPSEKFFISFIFNIFFYFKQQTFLGACVRRPPPSAAPPTTKSTATHSLPSTLHSAHFQLRRYCSPGASRSQQSSRQPELHCAFYTTLIFRAHTHAEETYTNQAATVVSLKNCARVWERNMKCCFTTPK